MRADKMYPYLKEKTKERLSEEERKDIFRNIKAMLMHKLGNVVVNNTDNLLISSFVGVISVGIYSNYFLLIGSVRQVLDQIFQGITASVGNLGATEDEGRVKSIFETAFFIGNWLYGAAAICLYELLNPFVELSFGKQYLFDMPIVLILCINFYINGTRRAVLTFRDSLGLFWLVYHLISSVIYCHHSHFATLLIQNTAASNCQITFEFRLMLFARQLLICRLGLQSRQTGFEAPLVGNTA